MAWLPTWYLNKPISHHKPAGLDAPIRQHLLSRRTVAPGGPRSSYYRSKSFLSSSIVSSGPFTECPTVLGSS